MVPTVVLTDEGPVVMVPDHEPLVLSRISEITDVLAEVARHHEISGRWFLATEQHIPYETMIRAIDAANLTKFKNVTIAGSP